MHPALLKQLLDPAASDEPIRRLSGRMPSPLRGTRCPLGVVVSESFWRAALHSRRSRGTSLRAGPARGAGVDCRARRRAQARRARAGGMSALRWGHGAAGLGRALWPAGRHGPPGQEGNAPPGRPAAVTFGFRVPGSGFPDVCPLLRRVLGDPLTNPASLALGPPPGGCRQGTLTFDSWFLLEPLGPFICIVVLLTFELYSFRSRNPSFSILRPSLGSMWGPLHL